MNHSFPIGVFDSGLGGLTVVRALRQLLANESIIYFGDTARVPYGTKSVETVTHFSQRIADYLLEQNVKMVVVACNTASAVALPLLQKSNNVPLVGVIEPGAEAAARVTRSNHIGVIGTTATITSNAYTNVLKHINADIKVVGIPCPLFVPLVEEGWTDDPVAETVAERYLKPFSENKVDTVILGCTHYPILKETIQAALPEGVQLVDSADAVSRAVKERLVQMDLLRESGDRSLRCFVTDLPQRFEELGERFLGESLSDVTLVQFD